MPKFNVTGPNGKTYRVNAPDGATKQDAISYVANTYYGGAPTSAPTPVVEQPAALAKPEEELGFLGALKRGATVLGDVPEALGFVTGEEGARKKLVEAQETGKAEATGFGMDKTFGENVQAAKELAGESLGFLAAPLAAGAVGSAATPVVGAAAFFTTLLGQYGTQNLARQAQEDEARIARGKTPLGAMPGRAAAAAVGQTGLDAASLFVPVLRPMAAAFPFLRPLIGTGGKKAAGEVTEAIVEAAAKKQLTIKGGIAKGVAQGVAFEIPQEVAQTVLERWQAKLDLTGAEAEKEYKQSAIGAAILGGGFGGVAGGVSATRGKPAGKPAIEAEVEEEPDISPGVQQEFVRLLGEETSSIMAAEPDITQQEAVTRASDRAEDILNQAKANAAAATAAAEETEQADAGVAGEPSIGGRVPESGVDVTGGVGAGVPPAGATGVPGVATPDVEVADTTGLVDTAADVGPPAAGEGFKPSPLTQPIYDAPDMAARKVVAKPVAISTMESILGDAKATKKLTDSVVNQATTQMAQRAARNEAFDPVEIVQNLMVAKKIVPAPVAPITPMAAPVAPPVVTTPPVEEKATAPVAAAIKQAVAPAPTGNIPSLAQTAAVETGIAPKPAPPVAAPAYTYKDLVKEADELLAAGKIPVEEYQKTTVLDELSANEAMAGQLPSPMEARQFLYEQNKLEASTLEAPAPAPEVAPVTLAPSPEVVPVTPAPEEAVPDLNTQLDEYTALIEKGQVAPAPLVESIARQYAAAMKGTGIEGIISPERTPALQQFIGNESSTLTPLLTEEVAPEPSLTYDDVMKEAEGYVGDDESALLSRKQYDQLAALVKKGKLPPEEIQRRLHTVVPAESVMARAYETQQAAPEAVATPAPAPEAEVAPEAVTDEAIAVAIPKLTKAQIEQALMQAGAKRMKADAFQKKIVRSRTSTELNSSISSLVSQVRSLKDGLRLLKAVYNSLTPRGLRILLPTLTTEDITRWMGDTIPGIANINKTIEDITVYRMNKLNKLAEDTAKWVNFNKESEEGGKALGDVTAMAAFYDVDPSLASSASEYLKIDPKMQELLQAEAKEKDVKKKSAIKGQITARRNGIARIYSGAKTEEGDVIYGWNDLSKPELGGGKAKAIYRMARDAYARNFNEHYDMLMQRIDTAEMSEEDNAKAKSFIDKMFAEARKKTVYFPLMRFGQYWLSVGKGANSEFYMFESAVARNNFKLIRQEEMKAANDLRDTNEGDDIRKLREGIVNKDGSNALKNIFEMLDQNGVQDTDILKDHIFQMYLSALPEADIRKRFIQRKFKTGFSADTLRNFVVAQHSSANQLARLAHTSKLKRQIGETYGSLKENPDAPRLKLFVEEVEYRALAEVQPGAPSTGIDWDKLATMGNKIVFLWMLTSPKSALIQTTQLHVVGIPVLAAEFGMAKTLATAARYTTGVLTGQKLGLTKRDSSGEIITEFGQPSIKDSKYISDMQQTNPEMYEALTYAWNYFNERDMFMSTYSGDLNDRGDTPSTEYGVFNALKQGRIVSAGMQGTKAAFSAMGATFHHMERMNREIMAMSTFELAYARAIKQKKSPLAARQMAARQATKLTYDALFNFSNYNKPRVFKHPIGRITTQFMSFSVQMQSYLIRNLYGMLPMLNAEGKVAAAKKLFGTVIMTGLYAGLTGLPLYGVFISLAEGMRDQFRDDDDDPELLKYADDEGNPLGKISLDFWFRTKFIPETFGAEGSLAKALGLTPEQAALLARAAELGPISAFTDLNVGASTSLNSLWFREELRSDTAENKYKEFIFNTLFGPLGALGADFAGAYDLYQEGHGDRAIEAIMPAFLRGGIKATRLEAEGLLMKDGREIRPREYYTIGKIAAQVGGFGSTETFQAQRHNILQTKVEKGVSDERNKLITRYDVAIQRSIRNSAPENENALDAVMEDIYKFNANFPTNAIGVDTLGSSQQQRSAERAASVEGSTFDPNLPAGLNLMETRQ